MSDTEDAAKVVELQQECADLMHAMQTGVATMMSHSKECNPKHLRVGVNSALVQNSALTMLLIRKGVITEVEYWETQAEFWRAEVKGYEKNVQAVMGTHVHLK